MILNVQISRIATFDLSLGFEHKFAELRVLKINNVSCVLQDKTDFKFMFLGTMVNPENFVFCRISPLILDCWDNK